MDALVQLATTRRRAPPVDVALAGGLLAWALLEAALVDGPGPAWARYLAAVAFSVPFAWRRRAPVAVLLVVVGTLVLRAATTAGAETGAMPFPALLLGAFSVALYAGPAWLAIACAPLPMVGFGAATALGYVDGEPTPVDMAILSFISLGAWTGGGVVRRRAAALAQAEAAAPVLAREAVAAERERMARELHDIVAHSVSIIAVQASAADAVLDDDPQRAREHMQTVRRPHGARGARRAAAAARRAARGGSPIPAAAGARGPRRAGRGGTPRRPARRARSRPASRCWLRRSRGGSSSASSRRRRRAARSSESASRS